MEVTVQSTVLVAVATEMKMWKLEKGLTLMIVMKVTVQVAMQVKIIMKIIVKVKTAMKVL